MSSGGGFELSSASPSSGVKGLAKKNEGSTHCDKLQSRAVRFQKFYLGSSFGFFGTKKPRFGSVSVIFKKEEQYKCMNSFMYVSSIFTK